jgi:hypothetical protein
MKKNKAANPIGITLLGAQAVVLAPNRVRHLIEQFRIAFPVPVVHKVCSTFLAFEFQARPVIAVEDAVRVELEAIAWRDGLKRK